MSILKKTKDILILTASTMQSIFISGNNNVLENVDLKDFKTCAGVIIGDTHCSLVYVSFEKQLVYYINPCDGNELVKSDIFTNWM